VFMFEKRKRQLLHAMRQVRTQSFYPTNHAPFPTQRE